MNSSIKLEKAPAKKDEKIKNRYSIEDQTHQTTITSGLIKLMLGKSLVDLALTCGNNTIYVHKIVLAANSIYFKEHFEKHVNIEEIIINGLDFETLRAIIEYMYSGETSVGEFHYRQIITAASLFKIKGLQCLESELDPSEDDSDAAAVHIPAPTFVNKKSRNHSNEMNVKPEKSIISISTPMHKKIKRKCVRNEAERACAKEAAASHMALELLKKELASSRFSSFVVEESCTETTVENFIPHNEEIYIGNDLGTVPIQINYDFNQPSSANQIVAANILPYIVPAVEENGQNNMQNVNENVQSRMHPLVDQNVANNMKILVKTEDGNFVNLKNVTVQKVPANLQYQILNESNDLKTAKNDHVYVLENDVQKKFNDNIHKFINIPNSSALVAGDRANQSIKIEEQNIVPNPLYAPNNYNEIIHMDENHPNYENINFILSENPDSYPVFIPSTSKDPLSEACDIAENLSLMVDKNNTNTANAEQNLNNSQKKYMINDKVLVERNFMEYSPRNLQGGRLLNAEPDVQKNCNEQAYKKKV